MNHNRIYYELHHVQNTFWKVHLSTIPVLVVLTYALFRKVHIGVMPVLVVLTFTCRKNLFQKVHLNFRFVLVVLRYVCRLGWYFEIECKISWNLFLKCFRTQRVIFCEFLLNRTEIKLYLPLFDWFGTKRTSVGVYRWVHKDVVNTFWYRFDLITVWKYFSVWAERLMSKVIIAAGSYHVNLEVIT